VDKEQAQAVQPAAALPAKIFRKVLDNGMTLLVKENHAVATLALRAVFLAGTRFENQDNNGINNLIANMLTRGTKSKAAPQIAQEIESMAGSLSGFSGRNSLGVSGNFLSRDFKAGMEIMADIILSSTFPPAELEKVRRDVLAAIKRREENLSSLAFYHFNRTFYKNHPYGLDPLGMPKTVKAITSKDLIQYKSRFMIPQNMVLAVVGDVRTDQVVELVEKLFGKFSGPAFSPPPVPAEPSLKDIRRAVFAKDSRQTHILFGFPGVSFADQDRYALEVLAGILSGQGGRLFVELRDRQALAYSVFAFSQEGLEPGVFSLYIASSPEKTKEAIDGIRTELVKIIKEEPGEEELKRAVNNIVGGFEIGLQRNSALAATMAFNELYRLGYDFHLRYPEKLLKVTAQQVLQAARKYINLGTYVLTLVGPSN
jgi:zinc protease